MLAENTERHQIGRLRVVPGSSSEASSPRAKLVLARTSRVRRFLTIAAAQGLPAGVAIRLAAERAVALEDLSAIGLDRRAIKSILHRAAARTRPAKPLSQSQADYARSLSLPKPIKAPDWQATVTVELPERLLTRIDRRISPSALDPTAISEAIAWELAATFSGRSLTEWALVHAASDIGARRADAAG